MRNRAQPNGGEVAQGESIVENCRAELRISLTGLASLATSNHHSSNDSVCPRAASGPAVSSLGACTTPALGLGLGRGAHWLRAGILQPLTVAAVQTHSPTVPIFG